MKELIDYALVLGVPRGAAAGWPDASITLLSGGKEVFSKKFAVKDLNECNWLESSSLQGYIVTWLGETNQLDAVLSARGQYAVHLEFESKVDSAMSLWLSFSQTWKQRLQLTKETIVRP